MDTIKSRLKDIGMSRYQLHKKTGISQSSLSRYFSYEINMSLNSFVKIIYAIDMEMDLFPYDFRNKNE